MKDSFKRDDERREELLDAGGALGPRDILDMDPEERLAYEGFLNDSDQSKLLGDKAVETGLGNTGDDALSYAEMLQKQYGGDGEFDHGYTGDRMTDLIGGDRDWSSEYTDDVVDTTLGGMNRQAERDRLARQGRQAATGGISSTRSAVEDAVAGGEHARALAEQEAALRDQAHRYGTDKLFEQAGMLDQSDQFKAIKDLEEQGMSAEDARATMEFLQGSKEFGMDYDKDMMGMWDALADSALKRGMGTFDIRNMFGEKSRGIDQQQADAERDHIGWLGNLLTGTNLKGTTPTGSTQTQTTPGNSALQNIIGIGTSLGGLAMMSDERVKEDIETPDESALEKLRKLDDGVQEYSYKEGFGHTRERTSGLMAQDLEKAGIEGAVQEIDGVKHVDPYPVLATVVQAVRELDKGRAA